MKTKSEYGRAGDGKRDKKMLPILIQLKGANAGQEQTLDEEFVKAVQNEYAVRYLEQLGLQATQTNIDRVLAEEPLSACELKPVWNNAGWLADSLTVIPSSKEGSFDHAQHKLKQRRAIPQPVNPKESTGTIADDERKQRSIFERPGSRVDDPRIMSANYERTAAQRIG